MAGLLAGMFSFCGLPAVVFAAPVPVSPAQDAPGAAAQNTADAPVLTLSAALEQAASHGPGFATAMLQDELRALANEADAASRAPAVTFSSRTDVHPALRHGLSGSLKWELTDDLSLDVSVSTASRAGDRLSVSFNRALWPLRNADLAEGGRTLDQRIARLRADEASFDAMRAVINAFYSLRDARFGASVAEQALAVATQRAMMAGDRFAAGQIGLNEWQNAQRAERQAQIELRAARTAHEQAEQRLARLLYAADEAPAGAANATAADAAGQFGAMVDDFPWSTVKQAIETLLAAGEDAVAERFLAGNATYLEAVRAELQQEQLVADAERATRINWHASVEYSLPLGSGASAAASSAASAGGGSTTGSSPGSTPGPTPGAGGIPGDEGRLTAYVGATLNLGPTGRIRHEQAQVSLDMARLRTEQARYAALDGAAAAVRAVENAAFARELAAEGLEQAQATMALVQRRMELGFAAPLELDEARLELMRAERDLARADAELRLAWLDVAHRLGATGELMQLLR